MNALMVRTLGPTLTRLSLFSALSAGLLLSPDGGPSGAHAAPCCMSATAYGVGRLLNWEDFAVGLNTSFASQLGHWGADGQWRDLAGATDREWRAELWGLAAVNERTSLFVRVPSLMLQRSGAEIEESGGGIADVSAGVRYELLSIGEYLELPAVAFTFSVLAPTGRATDRSERPLATDVTGRGAWVLSAGASIELTRLPWYMRLDVGASVPLPQERPDLGMTQRLGPSVDVALAGGVEVARNLVFSLVPRLMYGGQTVFDGQPQDHTEHLEMGVGLAASWRFSPHWTVQAGLDGPLAFDQWGRNQQGRLVTTLGLRYGHF